MQKVNEGWDKEWIEELIEKAKRFYSEERYSTRLDVI